MAIGSDGMMAAVAQARHTVLRAVSQAASIARIGSINSPMQCMMKEICAQCLQTHVTRQTGADDAWCSSCFNQDQPLDAVSFPVLRGRLLQNSVQEKLTEQWVDHCLVTMQVRRAAAE